MYDLIGDIHGHAGELRKLLRKLGYRENDGAWYHAERKVIFLGDFIDRGPNIPETLKLVRTMVDHGNALAVMGNHEYNAMAFNRRDASGNHLRKHSAKNIRQHSQTLLQFRSRESEYKEYIQWFYTLPLFLELDNIHVVHACWDHHQIAVLKNRLNGNLLSTDVIPEASEKGTALYHAVEETLKGKELEMPAEVPPFIDKDGVHRREIRVKWWADAKGCTYRSYSVVDLEQLPDRPVDVTHSGYPASAKPVFFGHYWLNVEPFLYSHNVCCLDYSVARQGSLVAYRWSGERRLDESNFFRVSCT